MEPDLADDEVEGGDHYDEERMSGTCLLKDYTVALQHTCTCRLPHVPSRPSRSIAVDSIDYFFWMDSKAFSLST